MKETKFKQTEIGMIPDDWEVKELGEIAFVTKLAGFEFTAHVKYSDQGTIIALRGLNVRQGYLELEDVKYIDNSNFSKLNRSKLFKDDLLFTYVGTVGNVALVDKNDSYYLAPNVALIRNMKQICSQYIMYLLLSTSFFNSQIKTLMSTTSQAALSMTNIRLFKIPLPPTLAEQQKIAKALSDVDNVISTLEKLITKKKNLKQGTMQQLLTGKKRLPGFAPTVVELVETTKFKQTEIGEIPEDWEVKELHELCDLLNGDRGINYPKDSDMVSNGIPFINAGHLQNGVIDLDNMDYISDSHYQKLSGAKIRTNDILFCLRGSLGKNAISNFDNGAPASSLCVIRAKKINHFYLFQLINSVIFEKQIEDVNTGSSQPNLSAKDVSNFLIPIPMDCVEQTAIANVLSSMDKEIEALNTKLEKYRNLKTGMMQQLLTGKIRLV